MFYIFQLVVPIFILYKFTLTITNIYITQQSDEAVDRQFSAPQCQLLVGR